MKNDKTAPLTDSKGAAIDEILHNLVFENRKLDYQYIRRESTRHNKKNALHKQAKQALLQLFEKEAITITEHIESGNEYIDTEAVRLSKLRELLGGDNV